jgi:hypothetical protein
MLIKPSPEHLMHMRRNVRGMRWTQEPRYGTRELGRCNRALSVISIQRLYAMPTSVTHPLDLASVIAASQKVGLLHCRLPGRVMVWLETYELHHAGTRVELRELSSWRRQNIPTMDRDLCTAFIAIETSMRSTRNNQDPSSVGVST